MGYFSQNCVFSKSLKIDFLFQKLSQKHVIWTKFAEPQGLKNVGSRYMNFSFFYEILLFFFQNGGFLTEKGKMSKKRKIQKSTYNIFKALWICIAGLNFMCLAQFLKILRKTNFVKNWLFYHLRPIFLRFQNFYT